MDSSESSNVAEVPVEMPQSDELLLKENAITHVQNTENTTCTIRESNKGSALDEKRLAEELSTAVLLDKRRKAVDDMKKRSVLTARSYDEFRHLVACAEDDQKPVSSKEMETLGSSLSKDNVVLNKSMSGSNRRTSSLFKSKRLGSRRQKSGSSSIVQTNTTSALKTPTSCQEFERAWRRDVKTPERKFELLMLLKPEVLPSIFKVEIPHLGEIFQTVATMQKESKLSEDQLVQFSKLLRTFTHLPQFEFQMNMLTKIERSALSECYKTVKPIAMCEQDDVMDRILGEL